jgi:hypothetical protein
VPEGEVTEVRIATTRERFGAVLGGRPRAKVPVEASTESERVARCLEDLGHEVIMVDPNFAPMYGMRTRRVKIDLRSSIGVWRGAPAPEQLRSGGVSRHFSDAGSSMSG